MLEKLVPEDFEPHIGVEFQIPYEGGELPLTLTKVDRLPPYEGPPVVRGVEIRKQPFILVFRSSLDLVLERQGNFPVVHPALGNLTLFLIPIAQDDTGRDYQCVFN